MKTKITRFLSLIVCLIAIAAMAINVSGCEDKKENAKSSISSVAEDEKSFTFTVTTAKGEEKSFEIKSDKETVGAALLEEKLISGDDSEYGLYVKTVDGETHDYETDGKYWAFYVNGEYGEKGVDQTPITDGATYSFKAES